MVVRPPVSSQPTIEATEDWHNQDSSANHKTCFRESVMIPHFQATTLNRGLATDWSGMFLAMTSTLARTGVPRTQTAD